MFLTNVFFIPFMALRAAPEPSPSTSSLTASAAPASDQLRTASQKVPPGAQQLPAWAPLVGAWGAGIGLFSIGWALFGRPEFGDLTVRAQYFMETVNSNRVSAATVHSSMEWL